MSFPSRTHAIRGIAAIGLPKRYAFALRLLFTRKTLFGRL